MAFYSALPCVFCPSPFTRKKVAQPGSARGVDLRRETTSGWAHDGEAWEDLRSVPAQNAEYNLLPSVPKSTIKGIMAMGTRNMSGQSKRVLLVDDDIELLLTYEALLQAHDYQTNTAANGAQALKLMNKVKVDAILCDLDMPELSGDLLYTEVGRVWPGLLKRFIFVTGNAENPIYEEFLKHTKPTVLGKPVSIDRLLKPLQTVLSVPASN